MRSQFLFNGKGVAVTMRSSRGGQQTSGLNSMSHIHLSMPSHLYRVIHHIQVFEGSRKDPLTITRYEPLTLALRTDGRT